MFSDVNEANVPPGAEEKHGQGVFFVRRQSRWGRCPHLGVPMLWRSCINKRQLAKKQTSVYAAHCPGCKGKDFVFLPEGSQAGGIGIRVFRKTMQGRFCPELGKDINIANCARRKKLKSCEVTGCGPKRIIRHACWQGGGETQSRPEVEKAENKMVQPKASAPVEVRLDLGRFPELMTWLQEMAEQELRSQEAQIIWFLREAYKRKSAGRNNNDLDNGFDESVPVAYVRQSGE